MAARRRRCPKCGTASIELPLFTSRRRMPVTCSSCGTRLERVFPGAPYYTLSFLTACLLEAAVLAMVVLSLFRQWWWMALVVGGLVLINLGVAAFLNRRTRVEFADPADARQDNPGRWYPRSPGD